MKKLFEIGAMCAASVLGAYAQYTTSCGIVVETVDRDFFDSDEEADEFYAELDKYNCEKQP